MDNLDYLVNLAANGDRVAFEELYRQTYYSVYFTCYSFLKNEQDAADITQDVYVTVMNNLHTLEDKSKFIPWLNRIAVNKCKNYLKLNKPILMDMETMENPPLEENENFLPEDYVTNQAKRQIVMEIMRTSLTDFQYQTVIMFYFNGLSVNEIADIMECPIGTVTYRLTVARGKIKQGVLEYENINDDKLYSAGTIPLLASLLAAEVTGLTNMYAQASNVINTASTNNIAYETAKIGVKGGMFKTLKAKIIAGIAGVAVVGGIAGVVILSNKDDKKEDNTTTEIVQTDEKEENTEEVTETTQVEENDSSVVETEKKFWLNTVEWGEEKDLDGMTVFNDNLVMPITLESIDTMCAPYYTNHIDNDDGQKKFDSIFDIVTIDSAPTYQQDYVTIYMQEDLENDCGIFMIELYDYSGENITVNEIYENNWWYIESYGYEVSEDIIGVSIPDYEERGDIAIADAFVDKYGKPSYILGLISTNMYSYREDEAGSDETFSDIANSNGGGISYMLVYERDEYVLCVEINENLQGPADEQDYTSSIYNVYYYTREYWDMFLPKEMEEYGYEIIQID